VRDRLWDLLQLITCERVIVLGSARRIGEDGLGLAEQFDLLFSLVAVGCLGALLARRDQIMSCWRSASWISSADAPRETLRRV